MDKYNVFLAAIVLFLLAILIVVNTFAGVYEITTSDNIVITIEGVCHAASDRVDCGDVVFYDVKEFRKIR